MNQVLGFEMSMLTTSWNSNTFLFRHSDNPLICEDSSDIWIWILFLDIARQNYALKKVFFLLRLLEVPLTGCHREQLCHDITQFPSSMLDRSHSHPLAWPTNPLMVRPRRLAHFYPPHRDPTLKLFTYDSRWRIEVRETLARDLRLCGSNLRLVGRNFYLQFWHWFDSFHFSVFLVQKDVRNNGINAE